jgi:predicted patatin/cPLA2 family phospholipase
VYGASAGACAGAYFLAGQARLGARLYYEVVNSRTFINPLHPFRRRAIFDLDRLFEQVLGRQLRLDFEQFRASGVEMVVLASHVDVVATLDDPAPHAVVEAVRFSDFTDLDDLMGALHASSRMPIVGGAPFTYRGMRYWDAAITQPVPIHAALADGCTHVLTLLTLPRDVRPGGFGLLDRLLVAPRVANVSPGLAASYRTRSERYRETCQLILSRSQDREGPPYVEGVAAAPATPLIGRTEIRTPRLIAAARAGGDAVLAAFGRADTYMTPQLLPMDRAGHHVDVRLGPANSTGPECAEPDAEAS